MHTPKHSFCHAFTQCGLVMRLANGLTIIDGIQLQPDVQQFFSKLAEVFLLFSHAESNYVKEELCKSAILKSTTISVKRFSDVLILDFRD